jgi:hypothetical protein
VREQLMDSRVSALHLHPLEISQASHFILRQHLRGAAQERSARQGVQRLKGG